MFQLLKRLLNLLFLYKCCVQQVSGHDVLHINGTAGQNITVMFTLRAKTEEQVNVYRDNAKIHTINLSSRSCFSSRNHTGPTICINNVTQKNISLIFTDVLHSGVYYLAIFKPGYNIEESNRVNLTVIPAEYTTSYTAAPSLNITSIKMGQVERNFTITIFVSVLFVTATILVIVLLGSFYWKYRTKTDKTSAVNITSAPQTTPDVTSVDYCVLDFPNRTGETVRSTEEPVEYSLIVFPLKNTSAQDKKITSVSQHKIKTNALQCEMKEKDKVSEKDKISKSKHQRYQTKITPNHILSSPKDTHVIPGHVIGR